MRARLIAPVAFVSVVGFAFAARAADAQLEALVSGDLSATSGHPGFLVGLAFGPHAALMTGVRFAWDDIDSGGEEIHFRAFALPIELELSARGRRAHRLVPYARMGVEYLRERLLFSGQESAAHSFASAVSAGARYWIGRAIAVALEAGFGVERVFADVEGAPQGLRIHTTWRLSLIVRP